MTGITTAIVAIALSLGVGLHSCSAHQQSPVAAAEACLTNTGVNVVVHEYSPDPAAQGPASDGLYVEWPLTHASPAPAVDVLFAKSATDERRVEAVTKQHISTPSEVIGHMPIAHGGYASWVWTGYAAAQERALKRCLGELK